MNEAEPVALPPLLRGLVKDFTPGAEGPKLSAEAQARWRKKLGAVRAEHRQAYATGLVAIAVKFKRIAPTGVDAAIAQLTALAEHVLGQPDAARDLVDRGAERAKTRTVSPAGNAGLSLPEPKRKKTGKRPKRRRAARG